MEQGSAFGYGSLTTIIIYLFIHSFFSTVVNFVD